MVALVKGKINVHEVYTQFTNILGNMGLNVRYSFSDKINQGYGAKTVQYRILGGNVYKPDNESWFNLDTMHYVCKVLREAGYKASAVYDKTDCNGRFADDT